MFVNFPNIQQGWNIYQLAYYLGLSSNPINPGSCTDLGPSSNPFHPGSKTIEFNSPLRIFSKPTQISYLPSHIDP